MRLRLRIERNALPPTQTLWPVPDPNITISALLQSINGVFPLEGNQWGLEDYSISISGYECLHYHDLAAVCRDEDDVLIKPLSFGEVKARRLAGRNQVASDGRHLFDGVPFGRPALKAPVRPEVRIPPRKEQKLLAGGGDGNGKLLDSRDDSAFWLLNESENDWSGELEDEVDEEEDDEDFDMGDEELSSSPLSSEDSEGNEEIESIDDSEESDDSEDPDALQDDAKSWTGITDSPPTPRKSVRLLTSGSPTHDSESQQIAGSKRKRDHDDAVTQDQPREPNRFTARKSQTPGIPFAGSIATKHRNARRRDSKRLDLLKDQGILPAGSRRGDYLEWERQNPGVKPQPQRHLESILTRLSGKASSSVQTGPTTEGSEPTTLASKNAPPHTPPVEEDNNEPHRQNEANETRKAKRATSDPAAIEERRQQLLQSLDNGGVDVTEDEPSRDASTSEAENDEPPQEVTSKDTSINIASQSTLSSAPLSAEGNTALRVSPSVAQRSNIDLAGTKRLLFGSLGVRVPKTQEEKDQLQNKLSQKVKNSSLALREVPRFWPQKTDPTEHSVLSTKGEANAPSDKRDWQSKLNITAIECVLPDVKLSAPPFPFHQYWDPQFDRKWCNRKDKARVKKYYNEHGSGTPDESYGSEGASNSYAEGRPQKKQKRGSWAYVETYDKYGVNGRSDALNYDEESPGYEDYSGNDALMHDWTQEEEAAVEGEEGNDDADRFPPPCASPDTLPRLEEDQACCGDFIMYPQLVCDAATKWQPQMVYRTAEIIIKPLLAEDAHTAPATWRLYVARRSGTGCNAYDAAGNRLYDKFEMPGVEEEQSKDALWRELGDVRLLERPETRGEEMTTEEQV